MYIVTTHYYIYSPLKYKDDGRDVVSFIDFVTIHGTFPAINAWISYQMYYYVTITVTTVCDTTYFDDLTTDYCANYLAVRDKHDPHSNETKYLYFYSILVTPSLIAFGLLFVESSINVTYYKDCVFALTSFFMFIGMYWVNRKQKGPFHLYQYDDD